MLSSQQIFVGHYPPCQIELSARDKEMNHESFKYNMYDSRTVQ